MYENVYLRSFLNVSSPRIPLVLRSVDNQTEVEMEIRSPRTRLEQLAWQQGYSSAEFTRQFAVEAGKSCVASVSRTTVGRWLSGQAFPRGAAAQVLTQWFGEPITDLAGPPGEPTQNGEDLAAAAAADSIRHALESAAVLDSSALEILHSAAIEAARTYPVTPPPVMLRTLVSLRDTVFEQFGRTRSPMQQADLYLLAGQVCGLLSSTSWDLGLLDAAGQQARAAYTYGNIIGHASLLAWARALQVTVAIWSGDTRQAVSLAATALDSAPPGTASARLHSVHARALALRGARGEVTAELESAAAELERAGGDPLLDNIGGELAFDAARRGLCAASSFVALRDGRQAQAEADQALRLFAAIPAATRWSAGVTSTYADLATARTLCGDLDGAVAALEPVISSDPQRCTEALTRRLELLSRILQTGPYRGDPVATQTRDRISRVTALSLPRTLTAQTLPPM